ncbi:uncharacterized protein [Dysidea avara]|uniref:uncharacterized protein isoform X2 n=1 Tax=Dysidea avara TaxID=196820 RepID=UPI00332BB785
MSQQHTSKDLFAGDINSKIDKLLLLSLKQTQALQKLSDESTASISLLSRKLQSLEEKLNSMSSAISSSIPITGSGQGPASQTSEGLGAALELPESLKASLESLEIPRGLLESFSSSSVASAPKTTHQKVPRELSRKIKEFYRENDLKFNREEQFQSTHNSQVTRLLKEQINERITEKYSSREIHRAVHRYYESQRRRLNDSKPERRDIVKKHKVKTIVKHRKKKMYSDRQKFVEPLEKDLWDKVPLEAMSSEEDASDDNEIIYHYSPSWRSDELNDFIKKLDQRIEQHSYGKRLKKKRIECPPHDSPAPFGLPQWMVKPRSESMMDSHAVPDSQVSIDVTTSKCTVSHAANGSQDGHGVNNATSTSSSFSLEYVDSEEESSSSDSTFEVDD